MVGGPAQDGGDGARFPVAQPQLAMYAFHGANVPGWGQGAEAHLGEALRILALIGDTASMPRSDRPAPGSRSPMSAEHKEALKAGRSESRAVRRYLEALDRNRPRRGRRRTSEAIRQQLESVEKRLEDAEPFERLHLLQERRDLEADLASLEEEFVRVAAAYSARKGISYSTWREWGVEAAVLRRAGITRGQQ